MKKLLPIIILLNAFICSAQNYQCLQSGVKHYFINGNGYLRGIRIDSVKTSGDTIVYYPFHTPRGSSYPLDSNGGSWLGKKVLQLNDGTFIFDSYWNDSVIIKTQANIGDSWVFYKDTSSLYYKATVVSKGVMTVLSSVDSVQTIMINAYNGSGIVTADPVNGFKIILSKNNGFVQVLDLYTFPYHKPDSAYRPGLDYFLDRSTSTYSNLSNSSASAPDSNITLFKLVDFINPNDQQLHNWNIGDVIQSYHSFANYTFVFFTSGTVSYRDNILETIVNKVISGHTITYTLAGEHYTCRYGYDPCFLIANSGTYTYYDSVYPIADTSFIPEENIDETYIFYFPDDTSHCLSTPLYILTGIGFDEEVPQPIAYKLGIGLTYYADVDVEDLIWEYDGVNYTNFNGIGCGIPSSAVNNIILPPSQIEIYPNPATSQLIITSTNKISQITISNLFGQTLYTHDYNTEKVQVDIADLPTGVYFVKINGSEVRKFVKE